MAAVLPKGPNRYVPDNVPYIPGDKYPESASFEPTGKPEQDAFLSACQTGNISVVRSWTQSIYVTDAGQRTALMFASMSTSEEVFRDVFQRVLEAPNSQEILMAKDRFNQNAIHYACLSQKVGRVQLLMRRNLPLLASQRAEVPTDFTREKEIHDLIGEKCEKMRQDFFENVLRIVKTMPPGLTPQQVMERLRQVHGIQVNITLPEQANVEKIHIPEEHLTLIANELRKDPPKSLQEASDRIQTIMHFPYKPSAETTRELLQKIGISLP